MVATLESQKLRFQINLRVIPLVKTLATFIITACSAVHLLKRKLLSK